MVTSAQVSVTTTATLLVGKSSTPQWGQIRVPSGGQSVFIGGPGVTTTTGYEVPAGGDVPFGPLLDAADSVYGVVAATTQTTHVFTQT